MDKQRQLAPNYRTCRLINGGWQLSSGHALETALDLPSVMKAFDQLVDNGFTTFDCADIYTGVEALIGQFIAQRKQRTGRDDVQVHTKFVPDLAELDQIDYQYVERIITRSLTRLNKEQLDLVQFHWWDYAKPGCLDVAGYLVRLKEKGLIAHLGTTNFDTAHLAQLVKAGYPLVSNQTQYSLLDRRPERSMVEFCQKHDVQLLCYGALAGGFLSERWLGAAEPQKLENRSLVKYQLVIEDSLGWAGYQQLLLLLQQIAVQRNCSIANVAAAYILRKPAVAAVIIGTRSERHISSNQQLFTADITAEDCQRIDMLLNGFSTLEGEPFDVERTENSKHRNIMKMNLNEAE